MLPGRINHRADIRLISQPVYSFGDHFAVWGLEYIMLVGFVGYQLYSAFSGSGTGGAVIDRTGGLFLLSCGLNILWLYSWHNLRIAWSMVIMLALLMNLFYLYQRIHFIKDGRAATVLWGRTPFSLYLGWIGHCDTGQYQCISGKRRL